MFGEPSGPIPTQLVYLLKYISFNLILIYIPKGTIFNLKSFFSSTRGSVVVVTIQHTATAIRFVLIYAYLSLFFYSLLYLFKYASPVDDTDALHYATRTPASIVHIAHNASSTTSHKPSI